MVSQSTVQFENYISGNIAQVVLYVYFTGFGNVNCLLEFNYLAVCLYFFLLCRLDLKPTNCKTRKHSQPIKTAYSLASLAWATTWATSLGDYGAWHILRCD